MKKLLVKTDSSTYPVIIGTEIFNNLNKVIIKENLYKNVFAIVDGNVLGLYKRKIELVLRNYSDKVSIYSLKPGESSKSYKIINDIYSHLMNDNFGRDTIIIAIGGGVTGDIAGFVASTFMRGVQLLHIPTTLISDVDSAIGGKTGFNFNGRKNIIGTFYQPQMVITDTDFLNTLPRRELTSGLGEIFKYSFLIDVDFYKTVLKILPEFKNLKTAKIENLIFKSVNFKSSVVAADEKESGIREILNFGHTFAHAFESELNFRIKHGEAVIMGIISALFLSNRVGLFNKQKLDKFLEMFESVKLPAKLKKCNTANLYKIMAHDKKNRAGKIKFVLLQDIGNIVTDIEIGKSDVQRAITSAQKFIS